MAEGVSGYNIISKLGDGARSQVYHVVKPGTGEVFALKRVIRDADEDTRFLDQAINEFNISSQFRHPNLRRVYDLKRIRKLFRMTEVQVFMEYVDGVSLDKARPAQIEKTLDILVKVAEGLQAMHDKGFLHADIKPNNILMGYDGSVRIIDFGQCCEIGFRKPRIQGTPDYIAPEQFQRLHLSQQTDVFNFGATLYWALTGRTFPTVLTKRSRKSDDAVPSPADVNPEVPQGLSQLVMECCEYDRDDRPRRIKDVIDRMQTIRLAMPQRKGVTPNVGPVGRSSAPPTTDRPGPPGPSTGGKG